MKRLLHFLGIILIALAINQPLIAQREGNNWYFGTKAGITFNSGTPVALTDGQMTQTEGCATISDDQGNLLFYTNGTIVYNRNHQQMNPSQALGGSPSSAQSAVIVKDPGTNQRYYIFTVPDWTDQSNACTFSIVDMAGNGGLGELIVINSTLRGYVREHVTATRHNNGRDVWILTHTGTNSKDKNPQANKDSDVFAVYLLTPQGIDIGNPVISRVGSKHQGYNRYGYLRCSNDGSKIASSLGSQVISGGNPNPSLLEIFDFNNSTGVVSNAMTLENRLGDFLYCSEFSPNNNLLYVVGYLNRTEIWQYDLRSGVASTINSSIVNVGSAENIEPYASGVQLGPDGRIYVSLNKYNFLGVINEPNTTGVGCRFIKNAVNLGTGKGRYGLPNFLSSNINPLQVSFTSSGGNCGTPVNFQSTVTPALASYSWNFGDPASGTNNTSTKANPTHSYSALGSYPVRLTVSLDNFTRSFVSTVNVTNINCCNVPTPIAQNNGPICEGKTLILDVKNPVTGTTYKWTGPNGFTSNLTQVEINPATITQHAGNYQVQATVGTCSSALSAPTNVVINPIPVADASANTPCEGGILSLSTPVVTGATYSWSGPNVFTSAIRNPQIKPVKSTDAGLYTVTVTAKNCTLTSTVNVSINPTPTITASSNSPVCATGTLELKAEPLYPNTTYLWAGPGPFSSSEQNPRITPRAGKYTVTATSSNGCSSSSSVDVILNTTPKSTASIDGPTCEGGSLKLIATQVTGATYSWTGPNNFTSTEQNPVIQPATSLIHGGTYTLQAKINGCESATSSVAAVINPIPIADAKASINPVCIGDKLTLSTGPVQGATYIWKAPNGVISNQRNLQIDPVTSGTAGIYTVTVIAKGCTSAVSSVDVKVSSIPDLPTVHNNGPLCNGADLQLTADGVTGATYSWTGPNGFVSTEQNPLIKSVTSSGTYRVRAIVNGCSSVVASTSVTVKPLRTGPTASANSPVCFGGAINLKATPIAGATGYTWTGPDGFTSNQQNPIATATSTGDYKVTAQVAGCPTAAGIVRVVVNPAGTGPSASGNSPVCEGGKLSLSITTPVAGTTYTWSGPNGFTSTSSNPVISGINANQAGDYKVTATSAGCTTSHTVVSVVIDPLQPGPGISGNTNLCGGDNLSLSVTPVVDGAIYTWVQPDGSSFTGPTLTVANVIYIHSGLYKVTSKTGDCSSAVSSVSVTVNSFSSAPTAGNEGAACEGGSIRLTASGTGGTGYSWTGPNGFSSSEQNPVLFGVTTSQAGQYKVKFVAGSCYSAESVTNVVVNATPDAPSPSNSSPVCPNGSVQLSLNVVNGAQYQWTGPDGFTSNLPTPVVNNVTEKQAGNYKVTATINGCVSLAGSTKVEVSPLSPPQVENQGVYCLGAPIVLTASSPVSGAMFQWTGPNNFTASGSTVNIPQATFTYVGKYSVYTEVNGCKSETTDTYVSVGRLITATENHTNVTATGANDGSIAVKIISGAPPYQFKLNQGNFSVDNNFVKLAEGNYSVTVQYGNGCTYEIKDIVIKQGTDDCVR